MDTIEKIWGDYCVRSLRMQEDLSLRIREMFDARDVMDVEEDLESFVESDDYDTVPHELEVSGEYEL